MPAPLVHADDPQSVGGRLKALLDAWDQAMVSGPSTRYAASGPVIRVRADDCRAVDVRHPGEVSDTATPPHTIMRHQIAFSM
jgi:hypothetical protein